jgi:hypothetical protein
VAQYTVTHSCGHDQTHRLFGPIRDREKKVEWLETTQCRDCWSKNQRQAAETSTKELELPTIVGSEKQIEWANRERLVTGRRFHDAIIASAEDSTIAGLLFDKYPGTNTLVACDRLEELFPGSAELVQKIRQAVAWFGSCSAAKSWIDSRHLGKDIEQILEYIAKDTAKSHSD